MPTISPAWTASETPARSVPNGSSASASRPRTSRRGVGSGRAGSRWVSGSAEPTISAASSAGEVVLRVGGAGDGPRPEDRRGVAEIADLLELVADVEQAAPFLRDDPQGLEQAPRRLGGQHRGRLVEDEESRALEEAAHDLDPLAFADGQVVEQPAGVERHPVPLGELAHARRDRGKVEGLVHRDGDVLGDGHRLEQREVLVDHADAEMAGGGRARNADRLPVPEDLALVRRERPVDDLHQGALARAVLAENRVDLARHHLEARRRRSRAPRGTSS